MGSNVPAVCLPSRAMLLADRVRDMMALLERQQKEFGDSQPSSVESPGAAEIDEIDLSFFKNSYKEN